MPTPADPLEQFQRLAQLRNAPLETQALQQQVQAGKLANAQALQQQTDQKAMTQSMQQWDGKSIDDLAPLVLKNGGSATAVMGLKQKSLEMRKQFSDIAAADATTGSKNLETAKNKNDMISGSLATVLQAPDEQLPQAIAQTAQELAQKGLIDPQHAQHAMQIAQSGMPPDQIRKQLDLFRKGYMAESQLMDEASKTATITKDNAQASQATAAAAKDNAEMQGLTGPLADSKFRNVDMAMKLGRPVSAEDKAFKTAYEDQKKIVPVANFNLQNSGSGPGAGGQPSVMAQMVASGRAKWGDFMTARTPQSVKEAFAKEVQSINPQFDTSTFGLETKAAEKATSGDWANTRLAYNTALDHSQLLMQAAKALQNGDVQALNSLKNRFGTEFGATGPITFNAIANAYNHEVGSVIAKGHTTDKEVETQGATLPANASLPQIQSVVGAYNSLMSSKRNELDKMIKAGAGNKADNMLKVGSDSSTGNNSGTIRARDPKGVLHEAPAGTALPAGWKAE